MIARIRLEPPVAIDAPGPPPPLVRFPPLSDAHLLRSRATIRRAAASVRPERAIVLGAGACREIPLNELLERFREVVLVDTDESALHQGLAVHDPGGRFRDRCRLQVVDLTGVRAALAERIEPALQSCRSPAAGCAALAALARQLVPRPHPLDPPYDLVICSTVLSQLHVHLNAAASATFARRFPGSAPRLRRSEAWQGALSDVARRAEAGLIDQLVTLVQPAGRIFLSATVRVAFVLLESADTWATAGAWLMTRTNRLADELDRRFRILSEERWPWVETAPQHVGQVGKLFDVQALVLARA